MTKHIVRIALCLAIVAQFGCTQPSESDDLAYRPAAGSISTPALPRPAAKNTAEPVPISQIKATSTGQVSPSSGFIVRGSGRFVGIGKSTIAQATEAPNGDIVLHFVNTSVADVAKAVLGDVLKLNYVVAPNVQGTVTLESSNPIERGAVLPALQTALRFAGATIVEVNDVWRVVPIAEAPRQGEMLSDAAKARSRTAGFAVQIVPLRYVSAEEMQHLLEPVIPQGSILRVDKARNLLVLGGSSEDLAAMREQISTFDVDWLSGMSFALIPLKSADAKGVADELTQILGSEGGPIGSLVRVVPIARMNALLLISSQPSYLDQLVTWVHRLDHSNDKADTQLYVYPVQNGRATDLATTLRKVFSGQSGLQEGPVLVTTPTQLQSSIGSPSPMTGGVSAATTAATPANGARYPSRAASPATNLDVAELGAHNGTGPQITADETNNALLILATAREYEVIAGALQKLDLPPLQVLIEASIAEVTLTDNLQYGVQYFLRSGNFTFVQTNTTSVPPALPAPGFGMLFSAGVNSQVILDLLRSVTKVNVISAPQMMVLNNQTATLQVGDQVPIATQSAVSVVTPGGPVVNTIEYRDTGVILRITPRVNQGGVVLLDVGQEVSDVSQTTSSSLNSPTISQRRFISSIAVRDGETTALGGLIRDSQTDAHSGIPLLRDIPVVGALFGDRSKAISRTELLVLITPHVVRTEEDARTITDEFRRRMRTIVPLERKIQ